MAKRNVLGKFQKSATPAWITAMRKRQAEMPKFPPVSVEPNAVGHLTLVSCVDPNHAIHEIGESIGEWAEQITVYKQREDCITFQYVRRDLHNIRPILWAKGYDGNIEGRGEMGRLMFGIWLDSKHRSLIAVSIPIPDMPDSMCETNPG
jgi:hypothetical protein